MTNHHTHPTRTVFWPRCAHLSLARTLTLALLAGLVLTACATTSLTRRDVLRQYDPVSQLADGVQEARGKHGPLLAPELFARTEADLNEAIEHARDADKQATEAAADRGLARLQELEAAIEAHQRVMQNVLETRSRALEQSADVMLEEKFQDAEERFRDASRMLEEGERDEGKQLRPQLIEAYAELELEALKRGTVEGAREAIAAAEEVGADDYAPATLREAREEVDLAVSVLGSDRTMVDKSNDHARRAAWLARRASAITTLAKRFEEEDLTHEEIVLWYQRQLQQVRDAFREETLPLDRENPQVVQALRDDASTLQAVMADMSRTTRLKQARVASVEKELDQQRAAHQTQLAKLLDEHEQQLAALESGNRARMVEARENASQAVEELRNELSAQAQAQARAESLERRRKARFEEARTLFEASEAEVFRQGDDVLIRVRGFDFASGKSEVRSSNYPTLNKLVSVINTFPESRVVITGHTDPRGSDERNLELSAARAQSVVQFLSSVGGVPPERLSAMGKGDTEPVATNETAEGRSKNRRIDVVIKNPPAETGEPLPVSSADPATTPRTNTNASASAKPTAQKAADSPQ